LLSLVVLFSLFAASRAWAQSIGIPVPPTRDVTRADPATFNWISHDDCSMNDVFHFALQIVQGLGLRLEVWAGQGSNDCTSVSSRTASTAVCLRVFAATVAATVEPVDIRARDLAAIESALFGSNGQGTGTAAHCDPMRGSTSESITLYFLLFAGGSVDPLATAQWSTVIDLVAPAPPTGVTAQSRNSALQVAWTPNTDPDVAGYQLLCGAAPLVGCTPIDLVPGQPSQPSFIADPHRCGSIRGASEAVTAPLANGQRVEVSVVAFDLVGNFGRLSELVCETPIDVPGSLSINGCSCSVRPASETRGVTVLIGVLALGAMIGRRRNEGR
jgi:MYXO-CTERM domain-containing protein